MSGFWTHFLPGFSPTLKPLHNEDFSYHVLPQNIFSNGSSSWIKLTTFLTGLNTHTHTHTTRRNRSTTSQILTIRRIQGVRTKNREATISYVDFSKVFDFIHRGKMEQILLAHFFPKETVEPIMMLYKNTKVNVHSPDGDTDYFSIVAGVLQGDTLAPYLFIIWPDYMLRTSIVLMKKKTVSSWKKKRSRRYPAQTIKDADYTDDIELLANKHA